MMESSLLYIQACQNGGQAHIALFEIGNSGHDLLVSSVASGLFQLHSQIGQFSCMGGIVADHVLHQRQQLFHGGVLTAAGTAVAAAAAVVAVVMGVTLTVEVVVGMGMIMVMLMLMAVCMLVGVGDTVMGMLMGVGMFVIVAMTANMIVMKMHNKSSLRFSFYYTDR